MACRQEFLDLLIFLLSHGVWRCTEVGLGVGHQSCPEVYLVSSASVPFKVPQAVTR